MLIEVEGGNGIAHLVDDVEAAVAGMVGQVARALAGRKRMLKPLLLDQTFLAGMGNIYTDEALHLAGLHPLTRSHTLSSKQARRLWHSMRQVLRDGILHNGASIDWVYKGGSHQHHFRVYRRGGEPCHDCGPVSYTHLTLPTNREV